MKLKTLAAVAALAVVGTTPALANIKAAANGTSEIFLVVGDANGSFLLDTGIGLNSFLSSAAGATGTVFSRSVAGAAWTAYTASDTNLFDGASSSTAGTRWALFVYDGNGTTDSTVLRALTTVGKNLSTASFTFDGDTFDSTWANTGLIGQQANGTGTHIGLPSVNGSSYNAKGTAGYAGANFFNFSGNVFIGNKVGDASRLVLVQGGVDYSDTVNASYVGALTASFDGSTLTVAAPVPEPQTYGLMLGGLAAVGFIARRRRSV